MACSAALRSRRIDLRRDDPVQTQVPQLVDLAHAARADPLDRLEAVEGRQAPRRSIAAVGAACRRESSDVVSDR